jgi:hypothetical protein
MNYVEIIQTLGFPIACVVACAFALYRVVSRDKDEASKREERLINNSKEASSALLKVANTIEESNKLNRELSETNRTLVDKVDCSLNEINNSVDKILERLTN